MFRNLFNLKTSKHTKCEPFDYKKTLLFLGKTTNFTIQSINLFSCQVSNLALYKNKEKTTILFFFILFCFFLFFLKNILPFSHLNI